MRKLFFTTACLAFSFIMYAQALYTTTLHGGTKGGGTICKLEHGKLSAAFNFDTPDGRHPSGKLLQASDGKLYGLTNGGGTYNVGTLFSYDPVTGDYKKLFEFDTAQGASPDGSLIQATDGKLYGTAYSGGKDNNGVLFSYNIRTGVYKKLTDFDDDIGTHPRGGLVQAANSKLYGMTQYGKGSSSVVFCYNPTKHILTTVPASADTIGFGVTGKLLPGKDGKLYGMTSDGGKDGAGVIFSLNHATGLITIVKDLSTTTARDPRGSLMQARDGNLYGMTYQGGATDAGVIFSINPATGDYTNIKDLDVVTGGHPQSGLFEANSGKLYGLGYADNRNNVDASVSVIFSLDPVTKTFAVHPFAVPYDVFRTNDFMQTSDGKVYSVSNGGINRNGLIYSFDLSTLVYTKLRDFGINAMGYSPYGGLAKDSVGILYGVTKNGGTYGRGVFFSFNPATAVYKKLADRDNVNGWYENGNLVYSSNGKIYGIDPSGGTENDGVIFILDSFNGAHKTVVEFTDSITGTDPEEHLAKATDGKLYGITHKGGNYSSGVIFSYDPITAIYTRLYDIPDSIADNSYGISYNLLQASDGKLYGMSMHDGKHKTGVIFSFDITTSKYVPLVELDFSYNYSMFQYCKGLMQATDGKLYGTAFQSLLNNIVIFSYNIATHAYMRLAEFPNQDSIYIADSGKKPVSGLTQGADGKLYGIWEYRPDDMEPLPGEHYYEPSGVYCFDPVTGIYTQLQDFDSRTGLHPEDTYFIAAPSLISKHK